MPPTRESIDLQPLEKSNPLYLRFGTHLEPDEVIYFSYFEPHSKKIGIGISLGLFIPTLILIIMSFISIHFREIIPLFLQSVLVAICFLSSTYLSSEIYTTYKVGNLLYLFTNKKIFIDYRSNTCQISYDNISSIFRIPKKKDRYQIDIILKKDINNNPFENKLRRTSERYRKRFFINKIPSKYNLFDKLIQLQKMLLVQ